MNGMKNIDKSTVLKLKEQVAYQPGQVVSRTLAQNDALSVTLFSFDKGEEISTSGGSRRVNKRVLRDTQVSTLHTGQVGSGRRTCVRYVFGGKTRLQSRDQRRDNC